MGTTPVKHKVQLPTHLDEDQVAEAYRLADEVRTLPPGPAFLAVADLVGLLLPPRPEVDADTAD